MINFTGINWCDGTHNEWIGCTAVSPACDNCYAEARMDKQFKRVEWGSGKPRVQTSQRNRNALLRANDEPFFECECGWRGGAKALHYVTEQDAHCPSCGTENLTEARRRIFVSSLSDVFDNEVPDQWRAELFDRMERSPNVDKLVLTKRIGNVLKMVPKSWLLPGGWPAHVWMGATVEDQKRANESVPKLLKIPAPIRFLSIEPQLGAINLTHMDVERAGDREWCCINALTGEQTDMGRPCPDVPRLHWIITGAESGPRARPSHPDWFRLLRDQCAAAGVAYLHKQNGEWIPFYDRDVDGPDWRDVPKVNNQMGRGATRWLNFAGGIGFHGERLVAVRNVGREAAGRLLDGVEHNQFPAVSA